MANTNNVEHRSKIRVLRGTINEFLEAVEANDFTIVQNFLDNSVSDSPTNYDMAHCDIVECGRFELFLWKITAKLNHFVKDTRKTAKKWVYNNVRNPIRGWMNGKGIYPKERDYHLWTLGKHREAIIQYFIRYGCPYDLEERRPLTNEEAETKADEWGYTNENGWV